MGSIIVSTKNENKSSQIKQHEILWTYDNLKKLLFYHALLFIHTIKKIVEPNGRGLNPLWEEEDEKKQIHLCDFSEGEKAQIITFMSTSVTVEEKALLNTFIQKADAALESKDEDEISDEDAINVEDAISLVMNDMPGILQIAEIGNIALLKAEGDCMGYGHLGTFITYFEKLCGYLIMEMQNNSEVKTVLGKCLSDQTEVREYLESRYKVPFSQLASSCQVSSSSSISSASSSSVSSANHQHVSQRIAASLTRASCLFGNDISGSGSSPASNGTSVPTTTTITQDQKLVEEEESKEKKKACFHQ